MFPCVSGAPLMGSFLPFSSFGRNIFAVFFPLLSLLWRESFGDSRHAQWH